MILVVSNRKYEDFDPEKGDPNGNRDCLFVCWALEAGTRALAWGNETKTPVGRLSFNHVVV